MVRPGFDEAPTVRLRVHRPGPLGVLHARQRRWPGPARIGWWLFLLPLAIFAWSSWRLRGVVRAGGYVVAGFVLLVGIAAVSSPAPPPPPPVPAAAPAPLVATTTPSPIALVPAPVVTPAPLPVVAPPTTPRPVTVEPRSTARPTYTIPARPRTTARVPAAGRSRGDTYTNVDGDQVRRPVAGASAPAGATAQCRDGTWSSSQHRSGTCSGHGGVARWL